MTLSFWWRKSQQVLIGCAGEPPAQHPEVAATAQNSTYHQAGQRVQGGLAVLYCCAGCMSVARNGWPTCIALDVQRDKQGAKPTKQQAAQMVRHPVQGVLVLYMSPQRL